MVEKTSIQKFLDARLRDPRYKHEDLDNGQNWATITTGDESDKHLEAQDRRSLCLKAACWRNNSQCPIKEELSLKDDMIIHRDHYLAKHIHASC